MERPYGAMYLSLLSMGFTTADLVDMPFQQAVEFIHAENERNEPDKPSVREATQADIRDLLM